MSFERYLKAHLNVAWLRPESALFDAIVSDVISKFEIAPPSLDLGCGNGIFSFITAGGSFSLEYDWYVNVDERDFWENKDIYDICKVSTLDTHLEQSPRYLFTYGMDIKENLLKQASLLHFYNNIIKCDANEKLPFKDSQLKTVFSNILYWLNDLKWSLKEIYRVLKKNGNAILCIPDTKFYDYCVSYHWKEKNSEILRLLNRGRSASIRWTVSDVDFFDIAKEIGFEISNHILYLSPLTLQIWDIGLRPISPLLVKMANRLELSDRRAIKQEWLDTMMNLLMPLYELEMNNNRKGGFHLFVLKK